MEAQPHELAPEGDGNHQPLIVVLLAVCFGILVDRYYPLAVTTWCALGGLALAAWSAAFVVRWERIAGVVLLMAVAAVSAAWHHQHWHIYPHDEIGLYAGDVPAPACVRAYAIESPKQLPAPEYDPLRTIPANQRSRVQVRLEAIRDGHQWRPASGKATLLVEGHLLGVHPGDRLQIFGRLIRPAPAKNLGEFDFAVYRRTERQLCLIRASYPDCVTIVQPAWGWNPRWLIAGLRQRGSHLLWSYLGRRRAGLAAAVLLGERDRLEHDRTEAFVETGTIHLLAISGLHIGILVSVFMFALRLGWLPRGWGLGAVAGLTIFYALLTDARPPVMRATVLIVVVCIAMYTGRRQLGYNTLAAAALMVLFWNPANLFRVGTQLSFLAVGTLIAMGPVWQRWQREDALQWLVRSTRPMPQRVARWIGRWFLRLGLAGLAVWSVALPLVMHHFHLFSPIGVLLTPLLYVPVALALFSGLGVLLFGWLFPPGATVCGWVCDFNLSVLEWGVASARAMPFGFFWVCGPGLWFLVLFYGALAAWIMLPRWRPPPRWCLTALCLLVLSGLYGPRLIDGGRGSLQCTFISVGHGCSVLLELPCGRTILYDAGRMGSPEAATRGISSTLWSRGHTHIDALIISHADADHFNCIPELLQRFSIGSVYVSEVMRRDDAATVRIVFDEITSAGIPLFAVRQGDRFSAGNVAIEVLHPSAEGVVAQGHGSTDNANSIVLAVEYQGRRLLLTGDLESTGLQTLTAQSSYDCDLLMAPHHGSIHSAPEDFAAWCQPEWTVVSSGLDAVADETIQTYNGPPRRLLHTAATGAITATIRDGKIDVHWHHEGRGGPEFLAPPPDLATAGGQ